MKRTTVSERALVLAPHGRDAAIAVAMLKEAGVIADACGSLSALVDELDRGAAVVLIVEEALATVNLAPIAAWISDQEEWSDLPFVLLTVHGGGIERNPAAQRYLDVLGNVTFVERPFHPTTLISATRSALRGRRRQYEARARLEALRENETRLRLATENAEIGFWDVDPINNVLIWPPRVKAMFGISSHVPVTMQDFYDGLHPDDREKTAAAYAAASDPELRALYDVEYRTVGKEDKVIRWIAAKGRGLFDHAGCCFRVIGTATDITARRNAEEQLRQLNETLERRVAEALAERRLLADVIGGTDIFVQVADRDFTWLAINAAAATEFARIFGVRRPAAGDNILAMLEDQPENQAALKSVWSRALAGEEFVEVKQFGDEAVDSRSYEMRFRTLRGPEGNALGAYQFSTDVTEQLREQARLAEAEEALRQAQKMEAVGQLTGGVAHDFNNLLTIIMSSTELLKRPGISEERRARYVEAISSTVDRASKLTGQLLAFARRQSLKPEPFDVGLRLQGILEMLATIVGSRVRIETNVSGTPCIVKADVSQFETAIVNLAVNARDAMDGEGSLTLEVGQSAQLPAIRSHGAKQGSFVSIRISDTGSGIPADKLAQIFEPFFTTKAVGKGTGLGLSQVYGFAKQSGGDILVESAIGRGTTFTLYLPREDDAVMQKQVAEQPASALTDVAEKRPRVLVVEDNVEVGTFSTQLLEDLGYDTAWAANADEALELIAQSDTFDVVFSDVIMPGMSGIELGYEIRRRYPSLPVVLTSGYSHVLAEEGDHGFELLQKPYAAEALSRVLRRVAPAPKDSASSALPS